MKKFEQLPRSYIAESPRNSNERIKKVQKQYVEILALIKSRPILFYTLLGILPEVTMDLTCREKITMKMQSPKYLTIIVLLICVYLTDVSFADEQALHKSDCFSVNWPHELSDLEPDPNALYGRLPNGFRYVIMENKYPKKRVALNLYINAGSLHETDDQQGGAHFLEHMLFNGTEHFKPGELVQYFQNIGMDFGGDTNAHTSFNETVYNILLPTGEKEKIDKSLLVMADYARGALLLESEINKERGVILAERRARDSAVQRARIEGNKFSMAGTKLPLRRPIGTLESLQKLDRKALKSFYDSWYRPENMLLVAVGDMKREEVEHLLVKHFKDMKGFGPVPECPDYGTLEKHKKGIFHFYEPDMGGTNISIESIWNEKVEQDSKVLQLKELKEYIASLMLNSRLRAMLQEPNTPFTDATYYEGSIVGFLKYTGISASTSPDDWKKTLTMLEKTLRQALEYGFTDGEFVKVKKQLLTQLDSEVKTSMSRDSRQLANSIVRSVSEKYVFMSPNQEYELYTELMSSLSLGDVEKSFKDLWSNGNIIIDVVGNATIEGDVKEAIAQVYKSSSLQEVGRWSVDPRKKFPYLEFAEVEKGIAKIKEFPDIDVTRLTLTNGTIINFKETNFEENRIRVRMDVGGGSLRETKPGMSLLAEAVVRESGFGGLTKSEIEEALAGRTVSYNFKANRQSFTWHLSALKNDEELLFQVMQTLLADPGVRENTYKGVQTRYKQAYNGLERDIQGGMKLHVKSFLSGGQKTMGWPTLEELTSVKFTDLSNWLRGSLSDGVREVSIVGDFEREKIISLCNKYLATLPRVKELQEEEHNINFPAGDMYEKSINSAVDKTLLVLAWPTADFSDIRRTRRLNMLAKIFDDRLRMILREKLGVAYSPVVFNYSSRAFKNYGFLATQLIVEPEKTTVIRKAVLDIASSLRNDGITEEELRRAKGPTLTGIKDHIEKNGYWLNTVLARSSSVPDQLEWPTTIVSDFSSISVSDLNVLAKSYLKEDEVAIAIISP